MVSVVQGTSNLHRLVPFYCFCLSWNFFIFRFLLSPSVCVSHFVFDSQGHIINSQIFPATSSSSSRLFPLGGSSAYLSFIDFKICRPTDLNIKQAAGVSVCVCVCFSQSSDFSVIRFPRCVCTQQVFYILWFPCCLYSQCVFITSLPRWLSPCSLLFVFRPFLPGPTPPPSPPPSPPPPLKCIQLNPAPDRSVEPDTVTSSPGGSVLHKLVWTSCCVLIRCSLWPTCCNYNQRRFHCCFVWSDKQSFLNFQEKKMLVWFHWSPAEGRILRNNNIYI